MESMSQLLNVSSLSHAGADPNGLGQHDPGAKLDHGKQLAGELFLSFPNAMDAIAEVATYGAWKYSRHGWKSVPDAKARYLDAMVRHVLAHYRGEEFDEESSLPHMWHALWNMAALVELESKHEQ